MLDRIDPLTKLGVSVVYVGWATLSSRSGLLASISALIVAWLIVAEHVRGLKILRSMLPFLFFAATSSWIYVIAPNPASTASGTGWDVALLVALRTCTVGMISIAFAITTEPADLARALVQRGRMPRRFVYGTLAAIQFLPALAEEARMARLIARTALSLGVDRQPALFRARAWLAGFNPALGVILLAGAVRRAGSAAIAMELRGLSSARGELSWRVPRFGQGDAVFAFFALLILVAAQALP